MKISLRSEYALLTLIYLARQSAGAAASPEAIAAVQNIPVEGMAEVLSVLWRSKYVKKAAGGYRLAKSAGKIAVVEILRLFDGALAPLEPVSSKGYASAPMDKEAKLCGLFGQLQAELLNQLEHVSLAELV